MHAWLRFTAEPLDNEALGDLIEDRPDDLILLDGQPFDASDLCTCDGCNLFFRTRNDLDEDGLCEDCAREADEEAEHIRIERAIYRCSVL